MTRPPRPFVVRRGEIQYAKPSGGEFGGLSIAPFPMPRLLSAALGVYCVDTADPVVALSYDDGPHPLHTPQILDVLAAHGARATFFVLSQQVERYPELARRIVDDGHELALHGRDHRSLVPLSVSEAVSQVRESRRIVESITGARIAHYRPPFGRIRPGQLSRIRLLGLDVVFWSSDAYDWKDADDEVIADRADDGVFPGGIVLLHDNMADPENLGPEEVMPAFHRGHVTELILNRLEERGYATMTVSELFERYRQVRSTPRRAQGYF